MNPRADDFVPSEGAHASRAIYNLRALLVLFIVAVHSEIPYLSFLPHRPYPFDDPPWLWRSFPVIDSTRFLPFDIFSAWVDIFVMALFFFVSGLFVWGSLKRQGTLAFLKNRFLRLGLPFALGVGCLIPIAIYPAYALSTAHPAALDYWRHFRALPFWPAGPLWFLWLLLVGDIAAACLYRVLGSSRSTVLEFSSYASGHPWRYLLGAFLASALAYVPLAIRFGPLPWFQWGPFSFQYCRPALYAVFFLSGLVLGARGFEESVVAREAHFLRHWPRFLAGAFVTFGVWLALSAKVMTKESAPVLWQVADDLAYVLACFGSALGMLAIVLRFGARMTGWRSSLSRNAYGIYLLHFPFVSWMQFALLRVDAPAVLKAPAVFVVAIAASWSLSALFGRMQIPARVSSRRA